MTLTAHEKLWLSKEGCSKPYPHFLSQEGRKVAEKVQKGEKLADLLKAQEKTKKEKTEN